ncbi:HAMP domain-containing sensor histidine kinase [Streptomyces sp. NPDC002055]|uniref:sensor histidine kinase n=1 Tax=Streptomyces sp. NPDC002055 TaxID=3154534 RepID=UPI0033285997
MRPNTWTIRVRLTLLYGGLVLLAGLALLTVTYVMLDRIIATQPITPPTGMPASATGAEAGPAPSAPASPGPRAPSAPAWPGPRASAGAPAPPPAGRDEREAMAVKKRLSAASEELRQEFRRRTLDPLIGRGALTLGIFALGGLWIGWLVSGRALRPISRIAATARRVADRSLHERIALTGPRDELRELADTFDDMLGRLSAAFEGQRRFVANASHELKTPLAINRTLLDVAMARPDAPPQLRHLGETLIEVNARHERLIEGLLMLARSEHTVADPVPLDLADLVRHAVDAAGPEAAHAGVRLSWDVTPAPLTGDPVLLERLVQNLLQNAIRYNTADGWVRGTCRRAGGSVRLTLANSGPVVAAHEVPALFEPFRRLDDRVGSARGTGLGLSIVRSVARAHGGTAVATPRQGGGLEVTVTLPAH